MSLLDTSSLPHTADLKRRVYEGDMGSGMYEGTPVTIASGVKCWLQNMSMREIEEFSKIDEEITTKLFLVASYDLRPGDTITITAGPANVGDIYDYVAQDDRSAGNGVLFRALLKAQNNERHSAFAS